MPRKAGGPTGARTRITFDTVRRIGLALPDVEESTTYGSPALKVRGRVMACLAVHKSAEPNSLVVRIDFDQRAELTAAEPDTYYFTDHYANYPAVLVRLSRVHLDALRDLLSASWRMVEREGRGAGRRRQWAIGAQTRSRRKR